MRGELEQHRAPRRSRRDRVGGMDRGPDVSRIGLRDHAMLSQSTVVTNCDRGRAMPIDASERSELEQLRLAMRLSGVTTWSFELGEAGDLTSAIVGAGTTAFAGIGNERGTDDLGAELTLVVHPDDRARVLAGLQACIDGTVDHYEVEYRVQPTDGPLRWRLGRGITVRDDAGRPIRIAGTSVDVTRLKQYEEDARAANERLELAAELSGFAVTECDLRGATDADQALAMISSES